MRLKNKLTVIILVALSLFSLTGCSNKKTSEDENNINATLASTTLSDMIYNSSQEINKGPTKTYGKIAYLTIDDGPSQYTDEMVKILKDNNVKATFFIT